MSGQAYRLRGVRRCWAVCGALLWMAGVAGPVCAEPVGSAARADLELFQQQVGQWLALKASLASEAADFRETERRMREEIGLLEARAARLEEEQAGLEMVATTRDAEQEALLKQADDAARALESLQSLPDAAEAALRRLAADIPESLQSELSGVLDELGRTDLTTARRLRLVLDGCGRLMRLQRSIHTVTDVMEIRPGEQREVGVLYLGLGAGYAVTGDGQWAALGRPVSGGGWNWRDATAHAQAVLRALQMSRNESAPELVRLPLNPAGEDAVHE